MINAGGERWNMGLASCDGGLLGVWRLNDDPDYPWKPGISSIVHDLKRYSGPARTSDELSVLYRPRVHETFLGFGFQPDHDLGFRRSWIVRAPYAAVVALFAFCPTGWLLFRLRARRKPTGFPVVEIPGSSSPKPFGSH
jgi:hypothetical protein